MATATIPVSRSKKLKVWAAVGVLALLLAFVGTALVTYRNTAGRISPTPQEARDIASAVDAAPAAESTEPLYILLMGDDRRPDERRARSDTLMLARIDGQKQAISLLSIPRDTRVEIEGHGIDKINAAYAYGGPALAIKTVKRFTGLPVNHYMQVDFQGLTDVVDAIGGLWIKVDRPVNDELRAQTHSGVDFLDKGYQRLNGAQSLTFVRSRAYPEGDFVRVLHQRQFLMALAKQTMSSKQVVHMPAIVDAASQHLKTDMSMSDIMALASDLKGMSTKNVAGQTVPGRGAMIDGLWYLLPDPVRTKTLIEQFRTGQMPSKPIDTSFQ